MKNNKKLKWFFGGWFLVMILFAALSFPEHKPLKKMDEVSFHVQENEELYFKNIRSYYYEIEEREDAQFRLYRLKARRKDSLQPTLNLAIVNNWRMDEAYVLIEPNFEIEDGYSLALSTENQSDTINSKFLNTPQQFILATKIYETLAAEGTVKLIENEGVDLFEKEEDRMVVMRVLKDYFKLIGKL
jgi:hypothetical protein